MKKRIVIFGNSGSGKSWLAAQLARRGNLQTIELDKLYWLQGGFNQRRSPGEATALVKAATADDAWVIEGVFGWLADIALPRAEQLIWLDVPEEECVANLRCRPLKSGEDEQSKEALLQWCREYRERDNSNSSQGHGRLFDGFGSDKLVLTSRVEIGEFLRTSR